MVFEVFVTFLIFTRGYHPLDFCFLGVSMNSFVVVVVVVAVVVYHDDDYDGNLFVFSF